MAATIYLVSKAQADGQDLVNGVRHVLINSDSAGGDSQVITEAIAACNTVFPADANGSDPFPAGYFDTVEQVDTANLLDTDEDAIVFRGDGPYAALRDIA